MIEKLDISTEHCTVERDGKVLIVKLDRPEAKNALSAEMLLGMYRGWRLLDEDDSLMCAILTATGDSLCAGGRGEPPLAQKIPDAHAQVK